MTASVNGDRSSDRRNQVTGVRPKAHGSGRRRGAGPSPEPPGRSPPGVRWAVEGRVGGTPVDVVGTAPGRLVAVELEWRRADPADDTAKLFRHLAEGSVEADRVDVIQVFTAYYDLQSGGVNSKRANAEFVSAVAADALDAFDYRAVDLDVVPPRGDGPLPDGRESSLAETAERILESV